MKLKRNILFCLIMITYSCSSKTGTKAIKPVQETMSIEAQTATPSDLILGELTEGYFKTESGLVYKILKASEGKKPLATDTVEVDYSGWDLSGKLFDSSLTRGKTASFPLNRVIKGWTEGLQLMSPGAKYRFWIPGNLAYGEKSIGGRPAGTLVFDVELHNIKEAPKPPETPSDVAAAPANALSTASGLKYTIIKQGPQTSGKPIATSRVTVHYSGWTTDGQLFDSSVARGETITFGLNQVIPGWTEGLQLMQNGDKFRFWIPGELAYGTEDTGSGRPFGTLVFDVELFEFE